MWSEREIKYFQRNGVDIANGFGLENVWNWRLVNWVERQIEGWMWCKWQWKIRYKYIFEITFSVAHKTCTDNAKILSKCKAAKCNFWLFVVYLFCSLSLSLFPSHDNTLSLHFRAISKPSCKFPPYVFCFLFACCRCHRLLNILEMKTRCRLLLISHSFPLLHTKFLSTCVSVFFCQPSIAKFIWI